MRLAGTDGQTFEMRILGYQFPHLETEPYDSNWLVIEGLVAHPRGTWRFRDPCLLTYEASRLANWMDRIAEGQARPASCAFIEPVLEFRAIAEDQRPVLRVYFELESRPAWARSDIASAKDLWVEFPLDELDLPSATRQWRDELSSYPQRTRD